MGFRGLQDGANENALTQPKFVLGITVIMQNVFQGDKTTKQIFLKIVGKNQLFSTGGAGGGGSPPWKIP